MKIHLMAVLISAFVYAPLASAAENTSALTADRISVFKAPLVCPAAPWIGCGGACQTILFSLEREPRALQGGLNPPAPKLAPLSNPETNTKTTRTLSPRAH